MSWEKPHSEEPTHEEFVDAWVLSESIFQLSAALANGYGYLEMRPEVCWVWFLGLTKLGVELPLRPYISHTEVDALLQGRKIGTIDLPAVEEITPEEVRRINAKVDSLHRRRRPPNDAA